MTAAVIKAFFLLIDFLSGYLQIYSESHWQRRETYPNGSSTQQAHLELANIPDDE